ncbi:hypothetical protein DPMN_069937 [Dreissena polymorpha]|uniref:Uncharacterized protein n=1 Tax=Dreissena polymorpha TaxID=45954 RepID=A0A9D3Z4H7_DREPO|nr:hypothetical protein DPMN_069937 [Dreissena polymorpha]
MQTLGKPELSENRTIKPVPRPSGLQRVYCIMEERLELKLELMRKFGNSGPAYRRTRVKKTEDAIYTVQKSP